jgi:hypothetical protein
MIELADNLLKMNEKNSMKKTDPMDDLGGEITRITKEYIKHSTGFRTESYL